MNILDLHRVGPAGESLYPKGNVVPVPATPGQRGSSLGAPAPVPLESLLRGTVPAGRARLWSLPPNYYCSIIGTCFPPAELRRIVERCCGPWVAELSELAVHERAVEIAGHPERGGRELHRALETRFREVIRRFDRARDPAELARLWEAAMESGEIPGAYWCVLTHRARDPELSRRAFGDVHMLSHLVGAANRADIRRLVALEEENAALRARVERQQSACREAIVSRDETVRRLSAELAGEIARRGEAAAGGADTDRTLRELVATTQRRAERDQARREATEAKLATTLVQLDDLRRSLDQSGEREQSMRMEIATLEEELLSRTPVGQGEAQPLLRPGSGALAGRTLAYVGGRPGQVEAIRALVAAAGGELLHHDGGIESRAGMLPGLISRADWVFFPVDCISHDAAGQLKRLCRQSATPWQALRTAGAASFLAGVRELLDDERAAPPGQGGGTGGSVPPDGPTGERRPASGASRPPPSRFCLRHG